MQLTKEDIEIYCHDGAHEEHINVKKIKKVVEFYETYKWDIDNIENTNKGYYLLELDYPKVYALWKKSPYQFYNDWLFYYCFKDGLK